MFARIGMMVAAAVVAAACGGSGASGTTAYSQPSSAPTAAATASPEPVPAAAPTPSATPTTAPVSRGTAVVVATSGLGQILVDGRGLTLYLFEADKTAGSTCYSSCATNWPPLLTQGTPVAGMGAVQSLLGTSTRRDGSIQVTYNNRPLYYFVADKKPGDLRGQGIDAFGGGWYVLSPSGVKIDKN